VLERLKNPVESSEWKQRAYVERFGVGRIVGLLGHGSAGVQAKTCDVARALTNDCASNRVAFQEGGVVEGLVRLLGSGRSPNSCGASIMKLQLRWSLWPLAKACAARAAALQLPPSPALSCKPSVTPGQPTASTQRVILMPRFIIVTLCACALWRPLLSFPAALP
jgi:hypothetical protein